jgi:hypothetical protein
MQGLFVNNPFDYEISLVGVNAIKGIREHV